MDKMTAVVTGSIEAMGTAICRKLAIDYQVIACYFKKDSDGKAKEWQLAQQKEGCNIDILYVDVSRFNQCEQLTSFILKRYQRIDVLVNNTGTTQGHHFKKISLNQGYQPIDATLNTTFNITRNILPFMLEQGYGRIITISSSKGRKKQFGQNNTFSAKSALFDFTKSLALEVAHRGITVNTISSGYGKTHRLDRINQELSQQVMSSIPTKHLGHSNEVANAVAFLASKKTGFITGANLDINEGQYI